MFIAGLLYALLEWRWFAALDTAPPMPPAEKRLRMRVLALFLPVIAVLLFLNHYVIPGMPRSHPWREPLMIVTHLTPVPLLMACYAWIERKKAALTETEAGPEVEREARRAASSVLAPPANVRVDNSREAWNSPGVVVAKDGAVVISQRLADALTPEEMRFAVALAVIEAPANRRWNWLLYASTVLPALWIALYTFVLRKSLHLPAVWDAPATFLPLIASILLVLLVLERIQKRNMAAADREALRATGDIRAAEGALAVLLREWDADAPPPARRWSWRFEALRESAAALGLAR